MLTKKQTGRVVAKAAGGIGLLSTLLFFARRGSRNHPESANPVLLQKISEIQTEPPPPEVLLRDNILESASAGFPATEPPQVLLTSNNIQEEPMKQLLASNDLYRIEAEHALQDRENQIDPRKDNNLTLRLKLKARQLRREQNQPPMAATAITKSFKKLKILLREAYLAQQLKQREIQDVLSKMTQRINNPDERTRYVNVLTQMYRELDALNATVANLETYSTKFSEIQRAIQKQQKQHSVEKLSRLLTKNQEKLEKLTQQWFMASSDQRPILEEELSELLPTNVIFKYAVKK